jgi:hypothetical protein
MNNLVEYKKRVEQLARLRNGEPISNGSHDHAAIIIEQMFKSAEKQVSILSGNLNARVYGRTDVVEQAKLFLTESERRVRILLESHDPLILKDHPLFERLRNNENLSVKVVPEELREKYEYHFLVMDDDSYRFEPTKDAPTAVAAFGDKKTAENILNIFNMLWEVSTEASIRQADGVVASPG